MRGSIKAMKKKGHWTLRFDTYEINKATGKPVRKRRWVPFVGSKGEAETKLADLIARVGKGDFVDPSKITVGQWLDDWMGKAIRNRKAASTVARYDDLIGRCIGPSLGVIRLQALKSLDLEGYYSELAAAGLSESTRQVHHALLSSALNAAVRAGLLSRNPASLVNGKPRKRPAGHTLEHVWSAEEAATFMAHAAEQGAQVAAFYGLALDTGARRGELAGLLWSDVDLVAGTVAIRRQMIGFDVENPLFSTTKTGAVRTITLSVPTIEQLKTQKVRQAEIKMLNRQHYRDYGLVFAKELDSPGAPLQANTIGERQFGPLCKAAGVKRIKLHGLRHTSATLLLSAGVPAHVVQQRLGHSSVVMTLGVYAHALPTMQQDAASRLAALLYGTK